MRWKWQTTSGEPREAPDSRRMRIAAELEDRGVGNDFADRIAGSIGAPPRSEAELDSLLDGIAIACQVQGEMSGELARNARDVQEIERLMGAFAGELAKLDEVLEVLAAYLRRMRTTSPPAATRILQ